MDKPTQTSTESTQSAEPTDKPVVLITEELSPAAVIALGPDVEVRRCAGTDRAALLEALPGADAVLVRSATRIDAEAIAAGSRLKVVGRAGVGVDNVDVPAATRAGVMVVNAPTANVVSAAELTVGLLLAVARNIPQAGAALREGHWQRSRFTGVELSGKTLGIIGLGRIGSLVAQRMRGFDMRLLAYDPYVRAGNASQAGVRMTGLDELLAESDFLTVHLPRTAETTGLIGFDALQRVKPGVRLVNAARGGIVDETELYAALKEGRVAGAALDVFATEPCTDSPLFELDNVVATPHLGAGTIEAQARAGVAVAESVRQVLAGRCVPEAVNVHMGTVDGELAPWLALTEQLGRLLTAAAAGLRGKLLVKVAGEITGQDTTALELAALKGALSGVVQGDVSYVNAPLLAQERGVGSELLSAHAGAAPHHSLVTVSGALPSGEVVSVSGTLAGRGAGGRLVEVCGFEVDLALAGSMAFFRAPGGRSLVGAVGAALGGTPIDALQIAHGAPVANTGNEVLLALNVGRPVTRELLDEAALSIDATHSWSLDETA
ncbi:phosphoglycerate dehydrogenase [Streptomyces broussonetiae]|uniref:D-3-phosphoglycerate dehydrogenase n=1 Tax=Streptomyces broussonetiae TaxID=2686304 RepID=A0A6I6NF06_9ACTN|nr:phosphoglycerate dehydrogenase [Streptomyces broussonetiae]QHA06607.1 phosphoglycerate dehydrogenase [Streptomyces broussonetiae]